MWSPILGTHTVWVLCAHHTGPVLVGGRGVNRAYSPLSTTHGHITDCRLDSVVYAGVCVVI